MDSLLPPKDGHEEGARGPWLRALAAIGFLGAALIHLAQVAVHLSEGLIFAGFFAIVGALQVAAAVALIRARRPRWYWLGVAASAATIAIWLVSRSLGLPFGAEPGSPEAIGTADAAASLLEGITIVALLLWLRERSRVPVRPSYVVAAGAIAAMGVVWLGARATGAFDPDVRLTGFPPELADRAALVLAVASVAMIAGLIRAPAARGILRPLLRGLLVLTAISTVAITVLTLPARGGQNTGCQHGPIAEVSGLTHAEPPEPVAVDAGQTGDVAVLRLAVCGAEPLMVMQAEPVTAHGASDMLVGFAVRDYEEGLELGLGDSGSELTAGAELPDLLGDPAGALVRPGETRELVARVRGFPDGRYELDSVRLLLRGPGGETTMTFATFLVVCADGCSPR